MAVVREVRACPACGSEKFAAVGAVVAASEAPSGLLPQTFGQPAFSIRCCTDCGLYFKSHTRSLRELCVYAAHREFNAYEVDGNFPTDRILQHFLKRLPTGRKVLDFGCNTGRILKGLTKHLKCFGNEVNEAAAAIARARGIQIVDEEQLRTGKVRDFDVIILSDVFEHLPRPFELLTQLLGALKPGGWLAMVTGNADAIRTRDRMAEYWYFGPPEHLLMMGERHVRWLADRLGTSIEELHHCSHYDTPMLLRMKQHLQSFAYHEFRRNPRGVTSKMLRFTPFLGRAERWTSVPSLSCNSDHFVAIFKKR